MAIKKLAFPVGKRRHDREGEEGAEAAREEASHAHATGKRRKKNRGRRGHSPSRQGRRRIRHISLSLSQIHDITIDLSMGHTPAHAVYLNGARNKKSQSLKNSRHAARNVSSRVGVATAVVRLRPRRRRSRATTRARRSPPHVRDALTRLHAHVSGRAARVRAHTPVRRR